MCQVNSKLHAGITSHGFFKSVLCLVKVTRWYSATRTNMWDKMTIYNSISSSFPHIRSLLFTQSSQMQNKNCKLLSLEPIFPITSHLWPGFMFSGVDGFSVDITTMVDIRDQTNKELAMRLVTDIQSGDVFYTDLNGFQVSPHTDK